MSSGGGWGGSDGWGGPLGWGSQPVTNVPIQPASVVSPLITCRALGPNNEVIWGTTLVNQQAVAQCILTRLRLFEEEWFADLLDGTPYWQSILGASGSPRNQQQVSLLIQQRILGTPYVLNVSNVQYSLNQKTRAYSFSCTVQTQFGFMQLTNTPQQPSQGLPNGK